MHHSLLNCDIPVLSRLLPPLAHTSPSTGMLVPLAESDEVSDHHPFDPDRFGGWEDSRSFARPDAFIER